MKPPVFSLRAILMTIVSLATPFSGPRELVYVNDEYTNCLDIYGARLNKAPKSLCEGIQFPSAAAAGPNLDVYVATSDGSGNPLIRVFARGRVNPYRTITGLSGGAYALTVGPNGAAYQLSGGSPGVMDEIPPGASQPTFRVVDPDMDQPIQVAVSASGGIYVAYGGQDGQGHVKRFTPGRANGAVLPLQVPSIQGVAIDAEGNIVVANGQNGSIEVFGQHGSQPKRTIPNAGVWSGPMLFDGTQRQLFFAGLFSSGYQECIAVLDYASARLLNVGACTAYLIAPFAISPPAP